jgi:O-antigen/teichoic acid export membrane protein
MSIQRHSLYNLAGSLAPAVVTFFTVPAYLQLIGIERYGILVIVWAFLGYFNLFDLGLGRATSQLIATMWQADLRDRAEAFWTALMLNTVFGVVGGLVLWPVARLFFIGFFQVMEPLRLEVIDVIPWLAAAVPITTVSGVLAGALQGRERFLALNVSSVLGTMLFQLLPLAVAWLKGPQLIWLVLAAWLGRVAVLVVLFTQCYHYVPLNIGPSVKRALIKPLFQYGGWVTVSGIISPLLTTLDRFLIGSIVGSKAVTFYTVPFSLATQVAAFSGSLSNSLFPRFSIMSKEESHRLTYEAIRVLSVILTPVIIAGVLIMEPFLTWWIGSGFSRNAAYVGEIIALGLWFNGLACIPFARLQAHGRPDLVAKCHLAELIPYLVFLVFALHIWGVVGAALVWSLRVTIDTILLFWIGGDALVKLKSQVLPLLFLGLAAVAVFVFPLMTISRWVIGAVALFGGLLWSYWSAPDSVNKLFSARGNILP